MGVAPRRALQGIGMVSALAILAGAGSAHAFFIDGTTNPGDMFIVEFELLPGTADNGGNVLPGTDPLTATLKYTLTAFSNSSITLDIDITNTTVNTLQENILSFGFFTNPEVTLDGFTGGGTFSQAAEDTNFPTFQNIDICVFAQNCTGGAFNNGLAPGSSDSVQVVLGGDFSNGVDIDPSAIKFQGELGSFEFAGEDPPDPHPPIPEPATLALVGVGLAGLGWATRRRRQRT